MKLLPVITLMPWELCSLTFAGFVEALSLTVEALQKAREQEYSQKPAKISYLSTAVAQMKESLPPGSR